MPNERKVSFFLAIRSLSRLNTRTTVLTIVIMSLIVFNLIFLPSTITGIGETFARTTSDYVVGDVIIEPIEDKEFIQSSDSVVKKIKTLPEIIGVSARYETGGAATKDEKFVGATVVGINPDDESQVTLFDNKIISGSYLGKNDDNEVVIGSRGIAGEEQDPGFTETLGGVTVGERINISYTNGVVKEYKIKGIYRGGSFISDQFVITTRKELESVLNVENKASAIIIRSDKSITDEELKRKLQDLGIKEVIKTRDEKIEGIVKEVVDSFSILNTISNIISLTIAVVVLFVVIYINTINKKRQIGMLRAIGITELTIIGSYMVQSLFYTLCGILIGGTALVIAITYLTANPIPFPPGPLIPIVEIPLIIQSLASLAITSLVAGFLPSWLATRQNIIESIWR